MFSTMGFGILRDLCDTNVRWGQGGHTRSLRRWYWRLWFQVLWFVCRQEWLTKYSCCLASVLWQSIWNQLAMSFELILDTWPLNSKYRLSLQHSWVDCMSEVFLHLWIVLVTKCKRGWGTLHCWYSHSTDSKWSLQRNPAGNCYGSQIENNSHCSETPIAMSPASGFFKLAKLTGRKISLLPLTLLQKLQLCLVIHV